MYMERSYAKKIILTSIFSGISILLSYFNIPIGVMKILPFQHMVNAIAGVIIGPFYAAIAATITGVVRNMLGTGTIFAFPGGIPGAIIVGLTYRIVKREEAALIEPVGTFIGALLSPIVAGIALGKTIDAIVFIIPFLASSIPGSILGYIILKALNKGGVL
ncbi:MAG: energy coupling factor transporter S component ThiW [Candidatus Methanomethylicia archaeon]